MCLSIVSATKRARKGDDGDGGNSIKNVLLVDILHHQLHL